MTPSERNGNVNPGSNASLGAPLGTSLHARPAKTVEREMKHGRMSAGFFAIRTTVRLVELQTRYLRAESGTRIAFLFRRGFGHAHPEKKRIIMFTPKFVRGSVALALVLTAGSVLAEQPARGGYRNSVAVSACTVETPSGASYRDSVARHRTSDGATARVGSAGYRDQQARLPSKAPSRDVAIASALACKL